MLTPRMPLYIPCVYNVFLYLRWLCHHYLKNHHHHHHHHHHHFSAVASWRAGLSLLPTVALSGILGEMIYAPYDITGAKFLWYFYHHHNFQNNRYNDKSSFSCNRWTWHDTDAPIRERLLGVPIGEHCPIGEYCPHRWVLCQLQTFYHDHDQLDIKKKDNQENQNQLCGW